jgi:subtilisin
MSESERVIYRLPPYVVGPQKLFYNQVTDKKPWSLVKSHIPDHWSETKGEGIVVAVLDTGLWKHKDLPGPVFQGNFTNSDSVFDRQGHGTHVAGTIGARLDGAGVVGWAPGCSLAGIKVLGDDGSGTDAGIAAGIRFAAEKGADIINMSLGGGFAPGIAAACQEVIQQGVFVICAAGNEGLWGENTVGWPAKLPETIAIASYKKDGSISDFSSRGAEVDIAFPGDDILSTWIGDEFRSISGTSMASPACAGVTALMLASHRKAEAENRLKTPIRNNRQLREHLTKSAQDMGDEGFDHAFGWGIPDYAEIIDHEIKAAAANGNGDNGLAFGSMMVKPITHGGQSGFFISLRSNGD